MYFAVGSAKIFEVNDDVVNIVASRGGGLVAVLTTHELQLWSGGGYRICLSTLIISDGSPITGEWHQSEQRLCIITTKNKLLTIDTTLGGQLSTPWHSDTSALDLTALQQKTQLTSTLKLTYGDFASMTGDRYRLFITTLSGYLLILSWVDATGPAVLQAMSTTSIVSALSAAPNSTSGPVSVSTLNCSITNNELAATFTDGSIAIMTYAVKARQRLFVESFSGSRTAPIPKIADNAVASLNSVKGLLAVSHNSTVCLHDIYSLLHKKAVLSLEAWNYTSDDLGDVTCMAWSPDQEMIAVGYSNKGI